MNAVVLTLSLALANPNVRPMHVVFLMKGDPAAISAAEMPAKQKEHLQYLESLWKSKRAMAIGPISDGGRTRGISILDSADRKQAREWIFGDPLVRSGNLSANLIKWEGDASNCAHSGNFLDMAPHRLVILKQTGRDSVPGMWQTHALYLEGLAVRRLLLASGPFMESSRFHSMLILEPSAEQTAIDELPAVKQG